jgi:hypothetical protein
VTTPGLNQILAGLVDEPTRMNAAQLPPAAGLYAWWVAPLALSRTRPLVPLVPQGKQGWSLLYVGVAPRSASSARTLQLRVERDHRSGNIGGSTFRQSLAALLRIELGLQPKIGHGRSRLLDEGPLSAWMADCCAITWVVASKPWKHEKAVLAALTPPLNVRHGTHAFRSEVKLARASLRQACSVSSSAVTQNW